MHGSSWIGTVPATPRATFQFLSRPARPVSLWGPRAAGASTVSWAPVTKSCSKRRRSCRELSDPPSRATWSGSRSGCCQSASGTQSSVRTPESGDPANDQPSTLELTYTQTSQVSSGLGPRELNIPGLEGIAPKVSYIKTALAERATVVTLDLAAMARTDTPFGRLQA